MTLLIVQSCSVTCKKNLVTKTEPSNIEMVKRYSFSFISIFKTTIHIKNKMTKTKNKETERKTYLRTNNNIVFLFCSSIDPIGILLPFDLRPRPNTSAVSSCQYLQSLQKSSLRSHQLEMHWAWKNRHNVHKNLFLFLVDYLKVPNLILKKICL